MTSEVQVEIALRGAYRKSKGLQVAMTLVEVIGGGARLELREGGGMRSSKHEPLPEPLVGPGQLLDFGPGLGMCTFLECLTATQ